MSQKPFLPELGTQRTEVTEDNVSADTYSDENRSNHNNIPSIIFGPMGNLLQPISLGTNELTNITHQFVDLEFPQTPPGPGTPVTLNSTSITGPAEEEEGNRDEVMDEVACTGGTRQDSDDPQLREMEFAILKIRELCDQLVGAYAYLDSLGYSMINLPGMELFYYNLGVTRGIAETVLVIPSMPMVSEDGNVLDSDQH